MEEELPFCAGKKELALITMKGELITGSGQRNKEVLRPQHSRCRLAN